MLVNTHCAFAPLQEPLQLCTWKSGIGTAVQVLLPPAVTLPGMQLTEPLPPATLALTVYMIGGKVADTSLENAGLSAGPFVGLPCASTEHVLHLDFRAKYHVPSASVVMAWVVTAPTAIGVP